MRRWRRWPPAFAGLRGRCGWATPTALLFQDLPNDRTMRWIEGQGVSVYRAPSHYANGQTRDRQGRLIACSHRRRCLYRTEYDGHVTTLVDRHAGKRLNSPNDVVVKSDGSIWFTDPLYGISNDYEGGRQTSEQPPAVYRLRTGNGRHKNCRERFRWPQRARVFARRNTIIHSRNRKPDRAIAAPIHSRFQCWSLTARRYPAATFSTRSNRDTAMACGLTSMATSGAARPTVSTASVQMASCSGEYSCHTESPT